MILQFQNKVNNNLASETVSTKEKKSEILARLVEVNTNSFPHWSLINVEKENQKGENRGKLI